MSADTHELVSVGVTAAAAVARDGATTPENDAHVSIDDLARGDSEPVLISSVATQSDTVEVCEQLPEESGDAGGDSEPVLISGVATQSDTVEVCEQLPEESGDAGFTQCVAENSKDISSGDELDATNGEVIRDFAQVASGLSEDRLNALLEESGCVSTDVAPKTLDRNHSDGKVVAAVINEGPGERLTWYEMVSVVRKVVESLQNQESSVILGANDQENCAKLAASAALSPVHEEWKLNDGANFRRDIVADVTTTFRQELEEAMAPLLDFKIKMEERWFEPESQEHDHESPMTTSRCSVRDLESEISREPSNRSGNSKPSRPKFDLTLQQSSDQQETGIAMSHPSQTGEENAYSPLVQLADVTSHPVDMTEELENMSLEIANIEYEESELHSSFDQWQEFWRMRSQSLTDAKQDLERRKKRLVAEYEQVKNDLDALSRPPVPDPPGPRALSFVAGMAFGNFGMLIIALNLVSMALQSQCPQYSGAIAFCDQVFLVWYTAELTLKVVYYQSGLFCGSFETVWWNWLDLCIVVSGIVDQWCIPLVTSVTPDHLAADGSAPPSPGALRVLRLLRVFRVLRALRFAKMLFTNDMSWTDGPTFQWIMASVIAVNTILMSFELDVVWEGWIFVENIFLVVYSFEIFVRIKAHGCSFFKCKDDVVWNYLDFVMVLGGVLDLWLLPLVQFIVGLFTFNSGNIHDNGGFPVHEFLICLKIMRLLRVLRLVRLMREVRALYVLMMGVWDCLKALQWVLVLTMLVLYASSIIFTNLVGKGYMYGGKPPAAAKIYFGSVTSSLFSLFRLMNGDTSVVDPITNSAAGQVLFVGFMIVSNWAVLAILTSVVSDHMISISARESQEEERIKQKKMEELSETRLRAVFEEIDIDGSGVISEEEWRRMTANPTMCEELCSAANLELEDLSEIFSFLAVERDTALRFSVRASYCPHHIHTDTSKVTRMPAQSRCLAYNAFMEHLRDESNPATKRSILHVLQHMKALHKQVSEMRKEMRTSKQ